jgi:hypothetical protein
MSEMGGKRTLANLQPEAFSRVMRTPTSPPGFRTAPERARTEPRSLQRQPLVPRMRWRVVLWMFEQMGDVHLLVPQGR